MAEENTALVADDGAQLPPDNPDGQQPPADDTPEPVANLARDLGWTPKEDWQGAPEKWKPAEQFIRDGRDIQQTTARELRSLREQMDRVVPFTETIIRDKEAEINARWEAKIAQAAEDGDTALAVKLAKERPAPQAPQQGVDPQVTAWVAKNTWYQTNPRAAAVAKEISDKLARDGHDVATQLKEAEAEVRERYPNLFPGQAKPPPATQTGAARNPNPGNRAKGFVDMPQDSQRMALDYEKRLGVKKEDFAKSYWQENEGVKK